MMAHITNLSKITELATQHDVLRERLAEIRAGHGTVLVVYEQGDGAGPDVVGKQVRLTQSQAQRIVLDVLAEVRVALRQMDVATPEPPSITSAGDPQ